MNSGDLSITPQYALKEKYLFELFPINEYSLICRWLLNFIAISGETFYMYFYLEDK